MSDPGEKGGAVMFLVWLVLIIFGTIGYVKNIIGLTRCDFREPYKAEIIRCAGVIPPVGVIVGWIDVGK